jgi:hypothetical protein
LLLSGQSYGKGGRKGIENNRARNSDLRKEGRRLNLELFLKSLFLALLFSIPVFLAPNLLSLTTPFPGFCHCWPDKLKNCQKKTVWYKFRLPLHACGENGFMPFLQHPTPPD